MTIRKFSLIVLTSLLATSSFAGSMGLESNFNNGFVTTLSLGPGWARPGEGQTLILQPNLALIYAPMPTSRALKLISTAQGTKTLAAGELFLGWRGIVNSVVEGQFGLVAGASSQVKLRGNVYEEANTLSYGYSYGIRNSRVAAKAKLLYDIGTYDLFPYLSGSAGVSFNHVSGFAIQSTAANTIPPYLFNGNNQTSFSYSVGLGLETALESNWRLGLGYELVNWGRSSLERADGQTVGTGLSVSSLFAHELLLSLSYLA